VQQALSISALANQTGVSSKALRYWERLGLLPRAGRTHTGYRVFAPETIHYVEFIQKSKGIGLTLAQMKRVLELSRNGRSPCPEVLRWIDHKSELVEQQVRSLRILQRRLRQLRRVWSSPASTQCRSGKELCCLIENLPDLRPQKGGTPDAQTLCTRRSAAGSSGR
jgi:DNA-binding transcriptional MerR regulator